MRNVPLYIIGNGFDLWHKLPTSYSDFALFAEGTLEEIEEYFHLGKSQQPPWHEFEQHLGEFDDTNFYQAHNHTDVNADDFRPSHAYALTDDLAEQAENLVDSIRRAFTDWILTIDLSRTAPKTSFPLNAHFLSFNYTRTLEVVYGIPPSRIYHIHGVVDDDYAADLIFGHGNHIQEEPELDSEGNSNRHLFTDAQAAAKYPLYALQKPVLETLKNGAPIFDTWSDVSEVVVIGHSLNEIDLPYFRALAKKINKSHWTVVCYKPEESRQHRDQLERCGVPSKNIKCCGYDSLPPHASKGA